MLFFGSCGNHYLHWICMQPNSEWWTFTSPTVDHSSVHSHHDDCCNCEWCLHILCRSNTSHDCRLIRRWRSMNDSMTITRQHCLVPVHRSLCLMPNSWRSTTLCIRSVPAPWSHLHGSSWLSTYRSIADSQIVPDRSSLIFVVSLHPTFNWSPQFARLSATSSTTRWTHWERRISSISTCTIAITICWTDVIIESVVDNFTPTRLS